MFKKLIKAFSRVGQSLTKDEPKKYNKKLTNYENICKFGVNPDSLIKDANNS